MENIFTEIGIEKEFFLLRQGHSENIYERIVEPKEYEFPADCFGFLVELRSEPWNHLNTVKMTWDMTKSYWEHRADKFGMELVDIPYMIVPKNKAKYFYNKYGGDRYADLTKNIYNTTKGSHHLGMFFDGDSCRLTAGMHVHFSIRDYHGNVIPFSTEQVHKIVETMDNAFKREITDTDRILGEYEMKQHGFEYRSTPCNVDVYKTLKVAFGILRKVSDNI
jgi:hypothetical protein